MSKKSSTFVPDFNSEIYNKLKYQRVMEKVCIFRVSGGSDWYRVYRNFVLGVGIVYEVYHNRKHLSGVWRYRDFDKAVDMAVAMAKTDIYFIKDGEDVK